MNEAWPKSKVPRIALPLALLPILSAIAGTNEFAASERLARTNLLLYHGPRDEVLAVKSKADWKQRRSEIWQAMQEVMGPLPGKQKRCPLAMEVEQDVDCGSYTRQLISYA